MGRALLPCPRPPQPPESSLAQRGAQTGFSIERLSCVRRPGPEASWLVRTRSVGAHTGTAHGGGSPLPAPSATPTGPGTGRGCLTPGRASMSGQGCNEAHLRHASWRVSVRKHLWPGVCSGAFLPCSLSSVGDTCVTPASALWEALSATAPRVRTAVPPPWPVPARLRHPRERVHFLGSPVLDTTQTRCLRHTPVPGSRAPGPSRGSERERLILWARILSTAR